MPSTTFYYILQLHICTLYYPTMVYTSDKDKRLNSINSCDPICKPSTPLDKSTQRGRPLVVSRAHPNFCTHCGERHASISCPAVDPVDRDAPIPTYSTALPVPPSRCPDCTVLKRTGPTITVLDGKVVKYVKFS